MGEGILPRASGRRKERLMGLLLPAFNKQFGYGPGDLRELTALLAGLGFGFALAHGDLLFAAFWRCHRNDGGRRRLVKGALAMSKVAVYIAFVLSTAWLLFGSWPPPQTVSGNHSGQMTDRSTQPTVLCWSFRCAELDLARKSWQRGAAAESPLTRGRGSTMLFLLVFLPGVFVTTHDWTPETCVAGSLGHRSWLHEYDTDLRRAGS